MDLQEPAYSLKIVRVGNKLTDIPQAAPNYQNLLNLDRKAPGRSRPKFGPDEYESVGVLEQAKPNTGLPDPGDERLLIERVQSGDFAAIEELYGRYSRPAFGLALKILSSSEAAEDAVQDAFLRFWRNPASFDPSRGRFATWLLSVVHNLCIDQLRRKRRNLVSLDQQENQEQIRNLADENKGVEEEVWLSMQRVTIQQALNSLPSEQRYVIELAFFKGLTHSEIAQQTGQPLGTIKSRIRQGLLKLKGLIRTLELEPGI